MKENKSLTTRKENKLRETIPSWIAEKENIGTAMYQAGQELILLIEQLLVRNHSFSEKQIKQLEEEIKHGLQILVKLERKGLSILSPHDMGTVGELTEIRMRRLETEKTGIALPSKEERKIIERK